MHTTIPEKIDLSLWKKSDKIHINQVGYKPKDQKTFVFTGEKTKFHVVDAITGIIVFTGIAKDVINNDPSSGESVVKGDFTWVEHEGKYIVHVLNCGNSYPFSISENIHAPIKNLLLKAFYYQRCGMELEEKYAGAWKHHKCHEGLSSIHSAPHEHIDTTGGWHDAGDFGKYVVPAGKAVADLMLSYEYFPNAFKDKINIPESENNIPDILNEVRYELEWMLKMQESTGAVYHKVATRYFPDFIMPDTEEENMLVFNVSVAATGDFAATMAMGARIYKEYDKEFSDKMIDAARKAWKWLLENPQTNGFKNPPDIISGEYGDEESEDERLWAAVEMYNTLREDEFHTYIRTHYNKILNKIKLGWADMSGYSCLSYAFMKGEKDKSISSYMKSIIINTAKEYLAIAERDAYGVTLKPNEYIWGSNMIVMNNAMILCAAHMLTGEKIYIAAVREQLNYILGCNPMDVCYITGVGSNPVNNIHHRPSIADNIENAVPGLLSGGPALGQLDEAAKKYLTKDTPPAKCFIDHIDSYSTNEITIYWNSPAVFVIGYLEENA